jgi:hypothetical protein
MMAASDVHLPAEICERFLRAMSYNSRHFPEYNLPCSTFRRHDPRRQCVTIDRNRSNWQFCGCPDSQNTPRR